MKKYATKIVISGLVLCSFLLFLELGTRIYNRLVPPPPNIVEFRMQQPLSYKNAPYFSKEFMTEAMEQPKGWKYPEGTRLIIPNDYQGKYFNVVNGCRVTRYQPKDFAHTVYLFGGSSVYCSEVPDEYTLASQLQLLLNQHYPSRYIVQNYGSTMQSSAQQLERLRTLSLKPDDVVIFYDGVNDIHEHVFFAKPKTAAAETNTRTIKQLSLFQKSLVYLSSHSAFIKKFANPIVNPVQAIPPHLQDAQQFSALLQQLGIQYRTNLLEASQYASAAGALFFHFLQPNLYTSSALSAYEKKIAANPNLFAWPGMDMAFKKGYPRLQSVNDQLREKQGLHCYDLTRILDHRERKDEEYYLDTCHVAHKGNQMIARSIFSQIDVALKNRAADQQIKTENK